MGPEGHGRALGRGLRSTAHAMHRRTTFLAGQSGQTFVEWLGLMAFIVVLVGLLVAAAPGLADKISGLLKDLIDAIPV